MTHEPLVEKFRASGRDARITKERFYKAFRAGARERDPSLYRELLGAYRSTTSAAMPANMPGLLKRVDIGSRDAIEVAIAFLKADAYFNQSGYAKARLIRHIKRAPLTDHQKSRLAEVVIDRVRGPDRAEFAAYNRLGSALRSDAVIAAILRLATDGDTGIRRRAGWMLARLNSGGPIALSVPSSRDPAPP